MIVGEKRFEIDVKKNCDWIFNLVRVLKNFPISIAIEAFEIQMNIKHCRIFNLSRLTRYTFVGILCEANMIVGEKREEIDVKKNCDWIFNLVKVHKNFSNQHCDWRF